MTTKPKTARKQPAKNPFADGAAPVLGGAWIRNKDGTLVRDGDTEQPVPESESGAPEQRPAIIPPPPAGDDTAGLSTDNQEG